MHSVPPAVRARPLLCRPDAEFTREVLGSFPDKGVANVEEARVSRLISQPWQSAL